MEVVQIDASQIHQIHPLLLLIEFFPLMRQLKLIEFYQLKILQTLKESKIKMKFPLNTLNTLKSTKKLI